MSTVAIGALVVIVVGALAVVLAPRYSRRRLRDRANPPASAHEEFTATTELRRLVVEATAAVLLLVGSWVALSEYQTTKERQDSERFAQAIELLGGEDATVRIGAVYSLESVARSDDLYYPVMDDMLTAMIRSKFPYGGSTAARPPGAFADPVVQAAVRVLGRAPDRSGRKLDLSRSDLHHVDFLGGDFRGALFVDSNLAGATGADANFEGADFTGAAVGRALCRARLGDNPGLPPNLADQPCP
ncbi:pentapeptide repeat-containing protein [Saccharothrix xinjiangensis]|uniref:Pentapeptide repeat-containing protein n=1 Tax=Saccharothrix xinjiangensis TaxID=204798 RepID=A0ABV9Y0M7_9PSEU